MNRLAIYATYTAGEVNTDYIEYMIERLAEVSDVILVSNCPLSDKDKKKYSKTVAIFERQDDGYDIGAYSYALEILEEEGKLNEYDELILLNDSIFGPIFPLPEVFFEMNSKSPDADFWGITKRGISNFDGGIEIYPEHLQLYFFVIREKLLRSSHFRDYMKKIPYQITDFRSAILKYEFLFTDYFRNLGYKYDTYCKTDYLITDNPNYNLSPYHYCMYDIMSRQKCPFIKRKLFTGEFVERAYTNAADLRRTFAYIDNSTDYDVDLIWAHILSIYNMTDIMKALQMTEVIRSNHVDCFKDYYDFISINRITPISDRCFKLDGEYIVYFDVRPNEVNPVVQKSLIDNVILNLFESEHYIDEVEHLFESDKRLGLVVPPRNTVGGIEVDLCDRWNSRAVFETVSKKFSLNIRPEAIPLYNIYGFVARKGIISNELLEELNNDSTGTVLQMLPFFVQTTGFYTKTIINSSYVPSLIENLSYISRCLVNAEREIYYNRNVDELRTDRIIDRILIRTSNSLNVYVYGAGKLAQTIVLQIKQKREIKGIVVSDTNGNTHEIGEYEVISLDELEDKNPFFIVAVGRKNTEEVIHKLKNKGYRDYLIIE